MSSLKLAYFFQTSPESPALFVILYKFFKTELAADPSLELTRRRAIDEFGWSEEDYRSFLAYAAAFFANGGNYKSFGDTKIVPQLEEVSPCSLRKV